MSRPLTNPSAYLGKRSRSLSRTIDGNYRYHDVVIRHGKPLIIEWRDGTEQEAVSLTHARNTVDDAYRKQENGLLHDTLR